MWQKISERGISVYIGIDLGGTNIAAGCTDDNGKLLSKASPPTMISGFSSTFRFG